MSCSAALHAVSATAPSAAATSMTHSLSCTLILTWPARLCGALGRWRHEAFEAEDEDHLAVLVVIVRDVAEQHRPAWRLRLTLREALPLFVMTGPVAMDPTGFRIAGLPYDYLYVVMPMRLA